MGVYSLTQSYLASQDGSITLHACGTKDNYISAWFCRWAVVLPALTALPLRRAARRPRRALYLLNNACGCQKQRDQQTSVAIGAEQAQTGFGIVLIKHPQLPNQMPAHRRCRCNAQKQGPGIAQRPERHHHRGGQHQHGRTCKTGQPTL